MIFFVLANDIKRLKLLSIIYSSALIGINNSVILLFSDII